jgi:hypothetical protein
MRYISDRATSLVGATTGRPCGGFLVSGFWRIVLVIATAATGAGIAGLHAQTTLMDPKDSRQIFATTCSACHKSPQGLAKSGQVAGFLRQHYTTGPEMSAAMAAYLVAAGSAPASKKGEKKEATASAENPSAKGKSKKQEQAEQAAASHGDAKERNARGKQRHAKQADEPSPARPAAAPDQPASIVAPEPVRQAAAPSAAATPAAENAAPAAAPAEPLVTLDLPLPPMPDGPPADLVNQTGFSSSPVP